MTTEQTLATYKKGDLLTAFTTRYNFSLPLEIQPSDNTLLLVAKMHDRRSGEFIPLSKISAAADVRDLRLEPTRIMGTPLFLDQNTANNRIKSDFLASPESFLHAVRVLMHTYTLVSSRDPPERTWCNLTAALSHVSIVEQMSRANSKANHILQQRLQEAEMSVRTEWTRVLHADPRMSLGDAILAVGQRHSIWPLMSEFKILKPPPIGNVKGGPKGRYTRVFSPDTIMN